MKFLKHFTLTISMLTNFISPSASEDIIKIKLISNLMACYSIKNIKAQILPNDARVEFEYHKYDKKYEESQRTGSTELNLFCPCGDKQRSNNKFLVFIPNALNKKTRGEFKGTFALKNFPISKSYHQPNLDVLPLRDKIEFPLFRDKNGKLPQQYNVVLQCG
jgi:hypothetical protein